MSFFDFTKMLFEEIENERQNIELKILDKILNWNNVQKIYLFATNQWHEQDTYYEAKIIKHLLQNKYNINIVEIKHNPTKRDEAFKFYEKFFEENKSLEKSNLIVSWSWWIAAMKEALNFLTIIKFSNSTIIDVNQFTNEISNSNADHEYLKNIEKQTIKTMISKYDYFACYNFYKQSRLKNKYLEHGLQYLWNRFNFNFEEAKKNLIDLWEKNKRFDLPKSDIESMIIELLQNIEITFAKWEYAMVIWKVFSLYEWLIKYLFEELYFDVNDFDKYKDILIEVKTRDLNKFVNTYDLKDKIYDKKSDLNHTNLQIWYKISELKKLKNMRNNSIIAHWFGGVSQKDAKKLIDIVNEIKKNFWITKNIFNDFNKYLFDNI